VYARSVSAGWGPVWAVRPGRGDRPPSRGIVGDIARGVDPSVAVGGLPGAVSHNWSGYAGIPRAGIKLTYLSANWVVPSVKPTTGFSSTWVGIDGDGNSDLIQTGTEQDFTGGHTIYRAWWEILPAPETLIPSMTISPGDRMFGSVKDNSGNNWTITLKDLSHANDSFSINVHYTGPGRSGEWIQEAPTGSSGIEPLAHYSTTEFSTAEVAGNFGSPQGAGLVYPNLAIAMTNASGTKIISIPSKPNAAGNAFRVAYGNIQPPAP